MPLGRLGPSITPRTLKTFARTARKRMRTESGGYRRDHLRALAQRVEVDAKEVRIMGSKSELLRTLVAILSAKNGGFWCAQFCIEVARPKRFELLTPQIRRRGVGHSLRGDFVRYMFSFRHCRIDPSK